MQTSSATATPEYVRSSDALHAGWRTGSKADSHHIIASWLPASRSEVSPAIAISIKTVLRSDVHRPPSTGWLAARGERLPLCNARLGLR